MLSRIPFLFIVALLCGGDALAADGLIDLTDTAAIRERRPLLIAHRGGVVSPESPECSLAAIRAAASSGYDMVELDVRESKDGVAIVFHDDSLKEDCGIEGTVVDFTAEQLHTMRYVGTLESIADLDTALALCRSLHLGVMLDVKQASEPCLTTAAELVRKNGLERATVTMNGDAIVQRSLAPVSMLRASVDASDLASLPADGLRGKLWFGLPQDLPSDLVPTLQSKGALVIPAINTFRYRGNPDPHAPRKDIERLREAGVDGFQIDSMYEDLFDK